MTETDMNIALEKLSPTDNDVIVIKFSHEEYEFDKICNFYKAVKELLPCPVIAIPNDMVLSLEAIDVVIKYLQDMKKS